MLVELMVEIGKLQVELTLLSWVWCEQISNSMMCEELRIQRLY